MRLPSKTKIAQRLKNKIAKLWEMGVLPTEEDLKRKASSILPYNVWIYIDIYVSLNESEYKK